MRKFRPTMSMHGALRIALTANNSELLRGNVAGPEDQEAMTKRFFILHAGNGAASYLSSLGGMK